MLKIDNAAGRIRYIAVNLENEENLELIIEIDGKIVFDHDAADIYNTGAGNLAIKTDDTTAGLLHCSSNSSLNYAFQLDFQANPLPFRRKCRIYVKNPSTTEYDIQAYYILYELFHG